MDAKIPRVPGGKREGARLVPPPRGTIKETIEIMKARDEVVRAWRDAGLPDAEFKPAPGDHGTTITVTIPNAAPETAIGTAVANLTNNNPASDLADKMRKFKSSTEAGEVPTTEGQSSGRKKS